MIAKKQLAIIGVQGVPGRYGGFETLAEQLVRYHAQLCEPLFSDIYVYCSADFDTRAAEEKLAEDGLSRIFLLKTRWRANGWQSLFHDVESVFRQLLKPNSTALCLGVSGAFAFPFLRLAGIRVVVNTDGIEHRRAKWSFVPRALLIVLERVAVWFADELIADNKEIQKYLMNRYDRRSTFVPYGGDHTILLSASDEAAIGVSCASIPRCSRTCLTICRVEPENHVADILEALAGLENWTIDFVGDWERNEYGRALSAQFSNAGNVTLMNPIWDLQELSLLRRTHAVYIHGHECGGTNPSLVEAMWAGIPTVCYDCAYNRSTTEENGFFFKDSASLQQVLRSLELMDGAALAAVGDRLLDVAKEKYTWTSVGEAYFRALVS